MIRKADNHPLLDRTQCRISYRLPRLFVDDFEHLLEWPSFGLVSLPAGRRFGGGICEGDIAMSISGDNGTAIAGECFL